MLDSIKLGQYLQGDSWYYRLDPRAKLVMSTAFIIIIFLANNLITYLGVTLFALALILSSGVSIKFFYRSIRPIFFLILITFVLNLFFIRTGEAFEPLKLTFDLISLSIYGGIIALSILFRIFKLIDKYISKKIFAYSTLLIILYNIIFMYFIKKGPFIWSVDWVLYKGAVINGSYVILRLILIISVSSLLTFTTKPTDLTIAIEKVLNPLKIFKLPISELALMISIALRFIPTLLEETQKILKAQTSRGADFTEGNLKEKVVQIISLLIPMFIISFKRAEDLANAMEARGYVPGKRRTSLRELKWKVRDTLYSVSFISLAVFLFYYRG